MISVVVPTYEREQCLYDMLKSMDLQDFQDFEVLIIDQSATVSERKITTILNCCRNVRYYRLNKASRPISKNFGIDKAKGEIILFCDDDIIVTPDFLSEHYRVHTSIPDVGACSCHLIEPHEKEIESVMPLKITSFGRFINKPNAIYNGFVTSLNGGNMSFKKEALVKAGYFDENLAGTSMLEEPDIAYRLLKWNYKLYFSSNTRVKHFPQYNGNINTRKGKTYLWQRDYFANQFLFMFRNKRTAFFPLVFIYLSYRTVIESIKNRSFSIKFLLLPFTSLKLGYKIWKDNKKSYRVPWHTPRQTDVEALTYITNRNEYQSA